MFNECCFPIGCAYQAIIKLQVIACLQQPSKVNAHALLHETIFTLIITAPPTEVAALRMEVKRLMDLVENLISEFQAVKIELESSRLDVDSIRCALCEVVASKQSNKTEV